MSRTPSVRSTLATALVVLTTGALSATAQAQTPVPGTVSAIGSASIKPTPQDSKSNASILAAVREARRAVIPRAVADARNRAGLLAAAGGLKLGALLSVADTAPSPFFGNNYGQDGTFGPGLFCGQVTRYRTTRTSTGALRRTRIGRSRQCRIPNQVTATETVTFATTP